MGDKYDEAFEMIVLYVTRLLFGQTHATDSMRQELVRCALIQVGVADVIEDLRSEGE